jgi:hypothetical protein
MIPTLLAQSFTNWWQWPSGTSGSAAVEVLSKYKSPNLSFELMCGNLVDAH